MNYQQYYLVEDHFFKNFKIIIKNLLVCFANTSNLSFDDLINVCNSSF